MSILAKSAFSVDDIRVTREWHGQPASETRRPSVVWRARGAWWRPPFISRRQWPWGHEGTDEQTAGGILQQRWTPTGLIRPLSRIFQSGKDFFKDYLLLAWSLEFVRGHRFSCNCFGGKISSTLRNVVDLKHQRVLDLLLTVSNLTLWNKLLSQATFHCLFSRTQKQNCKVTRDTSLW